MATAAAYREHGLPPRLYFYKKTEKVGGFMSQFYPSPFKDPEIPGIIFPTAEHYMHYRKAKLMGDNHVAQKILQTKPSQPSRAHSLGRQVKPFDSELWEREKRRIVSRGNWYKFTNPEPGAKVNLRKKLLATGVHFLVEATTVDRIWGIGFTAEHAERDTDHWGENLLGYILIKVRDRLAELSEERSNAIDAAFAKKVKDVVEDVAEDVNEDVVEDGSATEVEDDTGGDDSNKNDNQATCRDGNDKEASEAAGKVDEPSVRAEQGIEESDRFKSLLALFLPTQHIRQG